MERMTKRTSKGELYTDSSLKYYSYSDYQAVLRRLAYYEDLEEQERLVVLPCAVGDRVWSTLDDVGRLQECEVVSVYFERKPHENYIALEPVSYRGRHYGASFGAIGRTVFLTREEAENALNRMVNNEAD